MRIGIYGGSFDPPHIGHRLVASDACEALALDRLWIVPVGIQPLKADMPAGASGTDRLALARLAFAGDPRFEVSPMEVEREGLSYTVETIEEFARRFPGAELFFLVGRDALSDLERWRDPQRIRELATLAVLDRSGEHGASGVEGREVVVTTRRIDVSSTEIRRRVRAGMRITGFVPDSVEQFISTNGLYAESRSR